LESSKRRIRKKLLKLKNMTTTEFANTSHARILKLLVYSRLFNLEFDFIDKKLINPDLYKQALSVKQSNHLLNLKLKQINKGRIDVLKDALNDYETSNEKLYCIMSVVNKMLLLDEQQCLELEKAIELDEI
jgi:hypothetical protein